VLASFTDAGLEGFRLKKKQQIIKGVPRMTATHERESYWVFRGLTTTLDAGEALVLVSRDPARTNAALRVWANLLPVDVGQVQRPQRGLLVSAPQSRWVRELSVEQSIRMIAGIYGVPDNAIDALVAPVASTADVESVLHRPLEDFSKKLRYQIAFAVAIHADSDVVMFDHTTVVGSGDFRKQCLDRALAMRDGGKGLVVTTTKPQIALHLGTKAVILRGKRADQVGVAEAAEFLIRDKVKGRKRSRRREEDDDDDSGIGF
jgi:ABC-type polysaccharide/polyol phosphate transport system ATPase subunit